MDTSYIIGYTFIVIFLLVMIIRIYNDNRKENNKVNNHKTE